MEMMEMVRRRCIGVVGYDAWKTTVLSTWMNAMKGMPVSCFMLLAIHVSGIEPYLFPL
jgi:hypothetical protein